MHQENDGQNQNNRQDEKDRDALKMGVSGGFETDLLTNGVLKGDEEKEESSELIILGSGSSTGVPNPACLLRPSDPPCPVCHKAIEGPLDINKNYRCNPSLLINYRHADGTRRYIQIDATKNFKEQVLRWFLIHKIPRLDALILSHEHADASLGLDDIRGVQKPSDSNHDIVPLPVFVSQHSMNSMLERFPYLVEKTVKEGQEVRRVAQLKWHVIDASCSTSFEAGGLEIVPLPVMHGEDYVSLGFLFGRKYRVAYISDVSRIPDSTERLLAADGEYGPVDVLILDSLYKYKSNNFHFCWEDSLATVKRLRPKRAFFVGMSHEFEHDRDNRELAEWSRRENLSVQLAYDGMRIPVHI
ncbi:hypothetical protein R1sor_010604 [Riccia sorocarpa]|uniref:Metallo-beta-lactamase domain-containing protein n=1 Tax=Riccia sorocarpa TaxID=122646 RepID=A0ABD3HYI1_9MARC